MTLRLVTADDVCKAVQATLEEQVPTLLEAFAEQCAGMKVPTTWTQVPTLEALTSAKFPAGAISSNGTVAITGRAETIDATWRIRAGVFDRGTDYDATAARARVWAAVIRAAVLRRPSLDGFAAGTTWVSEGYRNITDRGAARTISGCSVELNVSVADVLDLSDLDNPDGPLPVVESTHPDVIVRPY